MELAIVLVLVGLFSILNLTFSSDIKVTSTAGTFLGQTTSISVDDKYLNVRQFLGIPYAEAPINDLRFKKPVAKQPLNGVYDATYHRALCPQGGPQLIPLVKFNISEDCLFLNIYTPEKSSENHSYAVIIYIHGGAFTTGGSNLYIGDVLSAYGDVIVVTLNYRLSIFGFLSSGDQTATGNFGLWDQHLAIRWVYENIAAFDGDIQRIILMGQSSGAASAIYQALYLGNKSLFKGVIAESGTPLAVGSKDTMQSSEALSIGTVGHQVGCPSMFPDEVVACLRNMTWRQIMSELAASFYQLTFSPVVDGEFICDHPENILDVSNSNHSDIRKFFSSLDLIIGGNNMDGASYMTFIWKPLLLVTDIENFLVPPQALKSRVIPNIFYQIYHRAPPDYAVDMIAMVYSDILAPVDTIKSRDLLLKLSTDYVFTIPNLKTARLHNDIANITKTFVYEFTSKSSLVIGRYPTPSWVQGANHGDETGIVFGFSREMLDALNISSEYTPTQNELVLSKKVMKMWSNFAKSGNPNEPATMPGVPKWEPFTTKTGSYMRFSTTVSAMAMAKDYGQPGGKFWLELMPTLLKSITISKGQKANATLSQDREEETVPIKSVPYTVIVIIVLGLVVIVLLLILMAICIQRLRAKHKEDIVYNSIEMDDSKRISV